MPNILLIFWFISVFLLITSILYNLLLKNSDLKKRLNYYLDIEKRYSKAKEKKVYTENFKGFLKDSNETVRNVLKKLIPGSNQKKLNQLLIGAGVDLKPEEYVMSKVFTSVFLGSCFYLIFNSILLIIIGLIFGFFLPNIWLDGKRRKRIDKFNDGLADMITTIIGSLKAGYSFTQALKTVAEESESPINNEIETVLKELTYGITIEEALYNLNKRMPSTDLELMIHATMIQRQIGGNLSTILEIIVNTIRERKKLSRHIRTLTAQGRLSGKIIAFLPVALALVMYIFNKNYLIEFATSRFGQILILSGVVLTLFGFLIINRITKIEV